MTALTGQRGSVPRGAFRQLLLTEVRLSLREPIGLVWGVGMPTVLVVIFGVIPAFQETVVDGVTLFEAYVPVLMVVMLSMLGLVGLPLPLVNYRELGVLRRMATTPVPPAWVLAAQLVLNLALALVTLVLILAISVLAFDVSPPGHPVALALTLLLSGVCLFALGLCVSAVARTARAAAAIGNGLFFPLAFAAGLWLPQQAMPDVMRAITQALPTGAAVDALNAAMAGQWPSIGVVLVLVAYAGLFLWVAARLFRWE